MQTGDIKAAGLRLFEYSQTYSELGLSQSRKWPCGTLCITIAANIGDTAILGIPACFPDSIVGFTPFPGKADVVFVKYALDLAKQRFMAISRGATQDNLSLEKLLSQDLEVPRVETQRRVAAILGAYDDLIEVNRKRVALLERMVQGLFEDWFVRFRFPGHEAVPMIDTGDGLLPEGWAVKSLSDLCLRITDGAHHSPPSVYDGRLMASVRDMRDWGFDYSQCRQISATDWSELERSDCLARPGDILVAKDGANLNKHTFLVWKYEPVVLLSSIAILRPADQVEREFLTAALKSSGTSAAIKAMRSGAAIPRIVLKDFRRLPILWPPKEIRALFESVVHPIHQQCRTLSAANTCLADSRDLLLPRLISGQLLVADAELELEAAA